VEVSSPPQPGVLFVLQEVDGSGSEENEEKEEVRGNMAGRGYRYTIHGAFGTKAKAEAKERRRRGSFVQKARIRGKTRWLVLRERI